MRVLVLGGDGYLGWPTAMRLVKQGFDVAVVDNFIKRRWERTVGYSPLNPPPTLRARIEAFKSDSGYEIPVFVGDIARDYDFTLDVIATFRPDAVVHYAEQPSAPFSMMGHVEATETQVNNVVGTLNLGFAIAHVNPDIHIVKLGTMGEYGTPNIRIEEGWLDVEHAGRRDRVLYPKRPGSLYHLSKVHDSHNLEFMARIWGLCVTDLNQGVVYGLAPDVLPDGPLRTSFHYDPIFGTVLNRFVVQAIQGVPLTVYGEGGQTRGYLNLRDTLSCVQLALENPPEAGEFRVFNQFTETFSVSDVATRVRNAAIEHGIKNVSIQQVANPRVEREQHFYEAEHSALTDLGLTPTRLTTDVLREMLDAVAGSKDQIDKHITGTGPTWKGAAQSELDGHS